MCTELAQTSTAGGATRTTPSLGARDSDSNLIARQVVVAPQGAAASFGQPDSDGNVSAEVSIPGVTAVVETFTTTILLPGSS